VTLAQTAVLGAIAGFTIFLGLPLGRLRSLSERTRGLLSMCAAGILLFIFWDVLSAAHEILEVSLLSAKAGAGWTDFAVRFAMAALGFAVGAFGLARLERRALRRRPLAPMAGGSVDVADPSAVDLGVQARRASLALAMFIAAAIGLHNFSEGLAIGVSARVGEIGLATTLIVGFAIHNATEGFGIVGPLNGVIPSWKWIGVAGLVGGGPTFLGTLVGYQVSSPGLEICFFTLAAGAILFVIGQLWTAASRKLTTDTILGALVLGYLIGLASDFVITYGGG
jgi:ZIP family zinc transporter